METISPRIPKNFSPERYHISFSPDYSNLKYTIKTEILIKSLSDNFPYLILNANAKNYSINYLFLYKFDNIADEWVEIGQKVEESKVNTHKFLYTLPEIDNKYTVQDGLYIPLNKYVKNGEILKLIYLVEGKMTPDSKNNALYLCTNYDEKKLVFMNSKNLEKEWNDCNYNKLNSFSKEDLSQNKFFKNLVTVFLSVPTKLRLNMPCFDEPCYKAIFSFQLVIDKFFIDAFKQLKCVTNGALIHVELDQKSNKYLFSYSDTPLMSTYLFTFVIGNYDLIETVNENKTKIRVFTPLRDHHDGALCMNLAQYSLRFYQKFFEINYYYEKLDFVPIPEMNFRAMENLGCIVFKNEAMLFSHFQSIFEKKFASRTISHEISHMWFGNLVTMEWWDDIWLNEGFARIFEFLCLTEIEKKENKFWDNFIYYIYDQALVYDERKDTHPIVRKIENVKMIDTIFDTISYAKGSSVIKMLMHYIGIDNFRKSIATYLKKYMYKNTETSMLWECFDEITKLKISELMNEWVNFSGHPLLIIDIIQKENKYYFKLEQKSMLSNDNTLWKLPVFIKSKNFEICRLINTNEYEISFEELNLKYDELEKGENFVVFNSDLKGFYRVKYNNEILLNSIFDNFKKNQNNLDEKIRKVNDIDIFGLLSYEKNKNNFEGIKNIINKIKIIENSTLLLRYMKKIYQDFKQQFYIMEGFEEYISNEETQLKIINQKTEYDNFFISIVDQDENKLNSLVKKFYINEENKDMYRYQFNDEFDSFYIYFRLIIDNNEEIAKNVLIPNISKNFEFLNKNYKYTLIEVMMKYIYLLKTQEEKRQLIQIIIQDYINNVYYSSYYINLDYKNAICTFGSLNEEFIDLINTNLVFDKRNIFIVSDKVYLQGKKNKRIITDIYIEKMKKMYEIYKLVNQKYKNIVAYFESPENRFYFILQYYWAKISDKDNESLVENTFYNYLKDKLNITSDDDCSQLLLAVQNLIYSKN
jgi:hypothetical protein